MSNPWDVRPVAAEGDDDEGVALYHAVGVALSSWEILESAVAALFAEVIGSGSRGAQAAYGTISSSPGRIDMVIAAAEEAHSDYINAAQLAELRQLLVNEVGKLSGRRNEIAHRTVTQVTGGNRQGHYLMPPHYNTRKRIPHRKVTTGEMPFKALKYAYTSKEVLEYAEHFWSYAEKVDEFSDRLRIARRRADEKAAQERT